MILGVDSETRWLLVWNEGTKRERENTTGLRIVSGLLRRSFPKNSGGLSILLFGVLHAKILRIPPFSKDTCRYPKIDQTT